MPAAGQHAQGPQAAQRQQATRRSSVGSLAARALSQVATAKLLSVTQPKVSALKAFKLDGFSVERLMRFLTALGRDVEIRITAAARRRARGRIHVEAA